MKVLVTGAAGFIGSFLVERGLESEMEVWAGIRSSSSREYLTDERIHFAEIDLIDRDKLRSELIRHKAEHERWDYIIHAAGATKCSNKSDFYQINYEGTKNLVEELTSLEMKPRMFVYISSLSVFGAIREDNRSPTSTSYSPISDNDSPLPNTVYGKSKLRAEQYLSTCADFPCITLRPTGVYGPREKDYFLMAKSIKRHIDFSAGFKRQILTFVYVKDLAIAAFLALEKGKSGQQFIVSDGNEYDGYIFGRLLQHELGVKGVMRLKFPLWLLRTICCIAEKMAKHTGTAPTLNSDKYNIMKQRNWSCSIAPIEKELGYRATYSLERGVKETVAWYKQKQWI